MLGETPGGADVYMSAVAEGPAFFSNSAEALKSAAAGDGGASPRRRRRPGPRRLGGWRRPRACPCPSPERSVRP